MKFTRLIVFVSLFCLLTGCYSSPIHEPGGPLLKYLMPFLPILIGIGAVIWIVERICNFFKKK